MSTIIKFELKELRQLASDKNSCVVEKKVTQNLALQPWCLGNLKESIKNLLDYKIGKFDKDDNNALPWQNLTYLQVSLTHIVLYRFNGILLSYKNLRILQNVGAIRNDNADIHFQVQADYFIFQPYVGATLKGIINKKSVTHLGILVHRVFNVVIPRPTEKPGNTWIGSSIQENQEVVFKVVVLDLYGALPYIRGELDESWIKLRHEEDDEAVEIQSKSIDVSYVNFDKTKPSRKPSLSNNRSVSPNKQSTNNDPNKSKNSINNGPNAVDIEVNASTKSKSKRHKVSDLELKQTDTNIKMHKKHKKDG